MLLCCRDDGNIKGRLEHLVSPIRHPPFILNTHMHKHTLVHFDICIPNETSGIGAEYLQLADSERENRDRGRLESPIGPALPFILVFHLSPILTGCAVFCISLWTFEFSCIRVKGNIFPCHNELSEPSARPFSFCFPHSFTLVSVGPFLRLLPSTK